MKQIPCPMNGARPEDEFAYGGRVQPMPAEDAADSVWAEYWFTDDDDGGEVWEWWCHLPTAFWFAARRNTATDEWLETMTVAQAVERLKL